MASALDRSTLYHPACVFTFHFRPRSVKLSIVTLSLSSSIAGVKTCLWVVGEWHLYKQLHACVWPILTISGVPWLSPVCDVLTFSDHCDQPSTNTMRVLRQHYECASYVSTFCGPWVCPMHLYLHDDYFVLGVRNHRIITTSRAIRTVSVRNMDAVFSWLCKHIFTSDGADSKSNNNVYSCTVVCILEKNVDWFFCSRVSASAFKI